MGNIYVTLVAIAVQVLAPRAWGLGAAASFVGAVVVPATVLLARRRAPRAVRVATRRAALAAVELIGLPNAYLLKLKSHHAAWLRRAIGSATIAVGFLSGFLPWPSSLTASALAIMLCGFPALLLLFTAMMKRARTIV